MPGRQTITCCQQISAVVNTDVDASIIEQMVVIDYYDGPIGGFIRCRSCGKEYHFLTLDWNNDQFVRVISLAEVPQGTFEKLASFFGESPTRKKWIPQLLSRATEEDLDRMEPFVASLVAQAVKPSIVLAWNVYTTEIIATRRINHSVSQYVIHVFQNADSPFDWFAYLGLSRTQTVPTARA